MSCDSVHTAIPITMCQTSYSTNVHKLVIQLLLNGLDEKSIILIAKGT